ncbi:sperm-associated antigen 8 isoform X2 [Buteo buteo]|uniref:sperm-associated antigen 8 isoform X2 n=1 Tax=Buteo buteo TaxID=30397 RepID=UPI003EBC0B40
MEPGVRRRGAETPGTGVALTGHVPPVCPAERPPCVVGLQRDVLLPEVPTAKPPCHRETLMTVTEMPQQMSATAEVPQEMVSAMAELSAEALPAVPSVVPAAEAGKDPCGVELPPCPGKWGTCPTEVPLIAVPVLPTSLQPPAEQPSREVPRGSCLIHNWQEERATNHLDTMPGQEPGSEGFTYRHGHHGLLVHQLVSRPTDSTTTKDTYRPPHRALLLGRGQREAMLESMLYQKYRKEMLEEIRPRQMPMESVSTTHRDYRVGDCQFTPLPATQGVTSICSGDSPFRRNAAFSTPITEYLEPPLPCAPLTSWLQPRKK